jgi:hypothetical protein
MSNIEERANGARNNTGKTLINSNGARNNPAPKQGNGNNSTNGKKK